MLVDVPNTVCRNESKRDVKAGACRGADRGRDSVPQDTAERVWERIEEQSLLQSWRLPSHARFVEHLLADTPPFLDDVNEFDDLLTVLPRLVLHSVSSCEGAK